MDSDTFKDIFKPSENEKQTQRKDAKKKNQTNPPTSGLKVLCLHGYRQNELMFREKLGAFRKMVGKRLEMTFITAPHLVPPMTSSNPNEEPAKSTDDVSVSTFCLCV